MSSTFPRWFGVAAVAALVAASPLSAQEQELDPAEAMLEVFFEGVPYERAVELDDEAIAALIAVIEDPTRTPHHANALVAIGMNGSPDAFAAIAAYADQGTSGELDRPAFRALRSVPYAMGHLARTDRRALRWLIRAVDNRNGEALRRFRHMNAQRVTRLLRRAAMTGLALSGQPRAAQVLERLAQSDNAVIRRHALGSLADHQRIASQGPHAVLGGHAVDTQ